MKKLECCAKSIFRILDKILWPYLGAGRLSLAETITKLTIVQKLRFLFYIFFSHSCGERAPRPSLVFCFCSSIREFCLCTHTNKTGEICHFAIFIILKVFFHRCFQWIWYRSFLLECVHCSLCNKSFNGSHIAIY